jgi:hypothetical protein
MQIEGSAYIQDIQDQGLLCAPMIETTPVALENSLDFFGSSLQPILVG